MVQGYNYTGTDPYEVQLNWAVDGRVVNPDNDPLTGLSVFVGLFIPKPPTSSFLLPNVSNPVGAFYGLLAGLLTPFPIDSIKTYSATGTVSDQDTLYFNVLDGDEFYLIMGLMAAAGGTGAIAESLSTLTASFGGDPLLTPAMSSVPIPPAVWLFGSSLIGLVGFASRKRAG